MTTYALFHGCNIPARVTQYADATRVVLQKIDIELQEIPDFNCCGYPMRNGSRMAFVLSAARNLALAEKSGHDLLVMCKCCFGNLKKAQRVLELEPDLRGEVNRTLSKEGLEYGGSLEVKHLFTALFHDVGVKALKAGVARAFKGLTIAASHGCHALRPSNVTRFDNPVSPEMFDALVKVTGAYSVEWSRKLDCCGAPLMGVNDDLSMAMAKKKMMAAKKAGAHYICVACPFSHLQFDAVQKKIADEDESWEPIGSILYPQLLGLSMGVDGETLGIHKNQLDISDIATYYFQE
ncbi:MAG: disulfide reductase [Desulfobacterales bacterium]|nr:disulfide reductase [Desulfobacterales bacterium]